MGGKNTTTRNARINGLQVQSAVYGKPLALGWGRSRVAVNLIDYDDFNAVEQKSSTSTGSKGGRSKNTTISYTYYATVIMGIGYGPITGVRSILRGSSVFTDGGTTALAQAGLTLFTGAIGQAAWAFMTGNHPSKALGYSGLAYMCASNYQLDSNGGLENHTAEVDFAIQESAVATGDANVADVVADFLTNADHGLPGFPSAMLGDVSNWRTYCRAQNLFVSPLIDQQAQASQFLSDMLAIGNADMIFSDGLLKFIPYGDTTVTANGYTFTPSIAPAYDLSDDDLIPPRDGQPPLTLDLGDPSQAFNVLTIQHRDRGHQYNSTTSTGKVSAAIALYGKLPDKSPKNYPAICDPTVGVIVANLIVQRTVYVRDAFKFSLPWSFDRLDPMDVVTITDAGLGLSRFPVRIVTIGEGDNGVSAVTAEPLLTGIAQAPLYPAQAVSGYQPNQDAAPGSISTPAIFNAPAALVTDLEVWAAVAGLSPMWGGAHVYTSLDGTTYTFAGTITGSARYGVTTASLAIGADPDTSHTLAVDLTASNGALLTSTPADADAGATLCWLGGELVAYSTATLTSAAHYDLTTYLRRGQNKTKAVAHTSGTSFVRLDSSIFKLPYLPQQVGQTIYVKFASFNIFGRAEESLAAVTAYSITLSLAQSVPDAVTGLALQSAFNGTSFTAVWQPSATAESYTVKVYKADGTTLLRTATAYSGVFTYDHEDAFNDGYLKRGFVLAVIAHNAAGDSAPVALALSNSAPAAVTGISDTLTTGNNAMTWTASTETDFGGYVAFVSNTNGFDPTTGAGTLFFQGLAAAAKLSSLVSGTTYYVRIAAYDSWTDDVAELNFSAQHSFTAP